MKKSLEYLKIALLYIICLFVIPVTAALIFIRIDKRNKVVIINSKNKIIFDIEKEYKFINYEKEVSDNNIKIIIDYEKNIKKE